MTETATQLLHRLTSYSADLEWDQPQADERLVHGFTSNDLNHRPYYYKRYEGTRRWLPRQLPPSAAAATEVLAGAELPPAALDQPGLARLLYLSAGVTRTAERNGHRFLFRAAGSAGARFPLELYLSLPVELDGLAAGVHWYDPEAHALVEIGPPPSGQTPTLVVTGVPWRTGWRYRERGYRHIYWDAGTMLAQLLSLADSAGLTARLFTRFPDQAVAQLIGADGQQEFPVAVVALGPGEPTLTGTGPATTGAFEPDAIEFPLITQAQRAGEQHSLGPAWPVGAPVAAGPGRDRLEDIVLRRGSTRLMAPDAVLPAASLTAAMAAAMRGITVPHWVAVNAVEGVEPGLYRWPELDRPERAGNLRPELYTASLGQGLPRDAGYVAMSAIDLAGVDDRAYRDVQLASGLVEGRLHLMAYALGLGASGMTFQDADLPALLGADVDGLLWTCVGVPEYRSKAGGAPGQPSTVRMISPRE